MTSKTMMALLASLVLAAPAFAQGTLKTGSSGAGAPSAGQNPAMNAGNQTYITSPQGKKIPLDTSAIGSGNGITANAGGTGNGVETTANGSGSGIFAWTPNFGTGRAARFVNYNSSNNNPVLQVDTSSAGPLAVFRANGNNVARINAAGKGFFNGGTQVGGADLAEFVPTRGRMPQIAEVVEIDPEHPGHFRLSSQANSTRVAGIISTAPGVTLNARDGAVQDVSGPALALAGRVPVKVTDEGGAIRAGDLLVASSTPGHAMRAADAPKPGTVIGKAMENFDRGSGMVEALVMLR